MNTLLGGVQWLFFMFANTVVIPLSIGAAFHLDQSHISTALQLSFIYTGIACILQALVGHRLSLMEGQSGLWWGLILSMTASAQATGISLTTVGGGLATGILAAGIFIAIFGVLGLGSLLQKWFTPIVMSVFLLLLASQLIIIFFKGMVGLSNGPRLNVPIAALSLFLVALVLWLNLKGRGMISNFSILIGIVVGWGLFALLFPKVPAANPSSHQLFILFPWGRPNIEMGFVITAFLTGLLNTTNTVASLRGAESIYQKPTSSEQYKKSYLLTGINTIVAGLMGLVPYAPYTSSLGFLRSTRIIERAPFLAGAFLFVTLGSIPLLGKLFSTLPISVGDAVLFVAYLQLFGSALQNIEGIQFNFKTIYRIATPTLLGIAIMNLPSEVFADVPLTVRPLISNGLLIGILLSIFSENLIRWSQFEDTQIDKTKAKH